MPVLRHRRDFSLLPIAALLPLLLYVKLGYGGQDFSFHAASWLELHNAWKAHEWELGWAQWAQFGFGEPRFCFYPPLSLLLGAALSFLFPFRFLPGVVVWLLLTLSGTAMYFAAGALLGRESRLRAALLYMFNPYLLVTVVLRSAMAEAWVQAILPLVFLCFYRAAVQKHPRAAMLLAGLFACAWLTNIPEAISIFYAFFLLAGVLAWRARSVWPLAVIMFAQAVGLALAAFRLLPAFTEQAAIQSKTLLRYDYRAYLRPWKLPPPHTLNFICLAFAVCAFALTWFAVFAVRRGSSKTSLGLCLLFLACFAVFVQLPLAMPLWVWLPEFKFVLFPFRFLPFLSLAVVLALSTAANGAALKRSGAAVLVLLALSPIFAFTRLLPFQRFSSIQAASAEWQRGFEGVREYVPAGVPPRRADPAAERVLARAGPFAPGSCPGSLIVSSPNKRVIETHAAQVCRLRLNTFYYPFWKAHLHDGSPLPVSEDGDGLLTLTLPPGPQQATLVFIPATPARTAANLVSLAALAVWFAPFLRVRRKVEAL